MAKQYTTRDLSKDLVAAIRGDSIARGNMVARNGSVLIAARQLELTANAKDAGEPVVLMHGSE